MSAPARWSLLRLSAPDEPALEDRTASLAAGLDDPAGPPLEKVAGALREEPAHPFRRTLVASGREDAAAALRERDPRRVLTARGVEEGRPVAFLFPGLGEQYPGMGRGLYEAEPVFRREVDRCAELLRPRLGLDLREVIFPPEAPGAPPAPGAGGFDLRKMLGRGTASPAQDAAAARLDRTELAQPAVFVLEYALSRLCTERGVLPAALIGHSLGEYVAATVAGVFTLEEALALVAERALLISEFPPGAMLGLPLSAEEAAPLLGEDLSVGAVNSPTTCVASGPPEAVAALEARLGAEGVVTRRLPTTHAFHSRMMEPVAERLAEQVRRFTLRPPRIPFVSNVTGTWIRDEEATDPAYWAQHLCRTVRFAEGVRTLASDERTVLLEVGPGQTLGGFARQSGLVRQVVLPTVRYRYDRQPDDAFLLSSLGRLWLAGVGVA